MLWELCEFSEMGTLWLDSHQQYSSRLWSLSDAQVLLRGLKCAKNPQAPPTVDTSK